MSDLLEEIWEEPYPVEKSKAVRWGNAADEDEEEVLASLQPLASHLIPVKEEFKMTKAQRKAEAKSKAKAKAKEAQARPKPVPKQQDDEFHLSAGDRANLKVPHGNFKGTHKVTVVSTEENGVRIRHDKDNFEEVIKWKHAYLLKGA
jgi:hypothetical protein